MCLLAQVVEALSDSRALRHKQRKLLAKFLRVAEGCRVLGWPGITTCVWRLLHVSPTTCGEWDVWAFMVCEASGRCVSQGVRVGKVFFGTEVVHAS